MRVRNGFNHELAAEAIRVIHESPRKVYVQDRRFQVVRWGARFEGIVQFGENAWAGWSRPLELGEVITCDGWKPGMGGGPEGVNWTAPRVPEGILWCQVWPMHGLFTPWPMEGFLRPLDEGDGA